MVSRIVPALLVILLQSLLDHGLAYEVVHVRDGGAIAGRVIFVGPIPELPPLMISKDHKACAAAARPEMLLISADSGVANTVVALEGMTRGKPPATHKPILDNHHCRMIPRVQAVLVGTEIVIQNSDPFLHTTRGRLPNSKQAFNLVFPKATPAKEQRIRFPGVIAVTCDTHAHMKAYIQAFKHPYFAVSDADGRFEITHIPPGRYTLKAWHEGWRILEYDQEGRPRYEDPSVMTAEVTVNPGASTEVEFQLTSPGSLSSPGGEVLIGDPAVVFRNGSGRVAIARVPAASCRQSAQASRATGDSTSAGKNGVVCDMRGWVAGSGGCPPCLSADVPF